MKLDLACSCVARNSCYQAMSKIDKKVYKHKVKTKTGKKLYKLVKEAYDAETKLFSRQVKADGKLMKDLGKKNKKLDRIVAKRLKWYESFLKVKGAKKWKMKDRVKVMNKHYLQKISKKEQARLKREGIFGKMQAMLKSKLIGGAYGDYVSGTGNLASTRNQVVKDFVNNIDVSTKEVANSDNPLDRNNTDLEARANAMKKKKFKFDTIIKKKKISIFKVISRRYTVVINSQRLRIPTKEGLVTPKQRKKILSGFAELIQKL